MKNNKILIAAASLCLLFTSLSVTAYADEAAADNSAIVKSPDTVEDKGISAAFIGAGISALAILVCKKCKSYTAR